MGCWSGCILNGFLPIIKVKNQHISNAFAGYVLTNKKPDPSEDTFSVPDNQLDCSFI